MASTQPGSGGSWWPSVFSGSRCEASLALPFPIKRRHALSAQSAAVSPEGAARSLITPPAGMELASDAARRRGRKRNTAAAHARTKPAPTVARLCSWASSYDVQPWQRSPEIKVTLNLIKK